MKEIKATEIINKIQQLDRTIKNDWAIIRTHIDHNTTETPMYDLNNVLKEIKKFSKELVEYKLMSVCINMGFVSIQQLSENSSYRIIYELSELVAQEKQLKSLIERPKRSGKHIESLLKDSFLKDQLKTIQQGISVHKANLDTFNNSKTLIVNEVA